MKIYLLYDLDESLKILRKSYNMINKMLLFQKHGNSN